MVSDAAIRAGTRLLTVAAFLSFVLWIAWLLPVLLLAALLLGGGAYGLFLIDRQRNPPAPRGIGRDSDDRILEGSEVAIAPGVSAGGIHLTYESRSRWRRER